MIKDIVNEELLHRTLEKTKNPTEEQIIGILRKARKKQGLTLEEVGALLNATDPALTQQMFSTAGKIKRDIYGERLVLFAPLYVSSFCVNDCAYCGFRARNTAERKKLSLEEVREQVRILEDMGHKRLLLEFGEHPTETPIDYIVEVIRTIYDTKSGKGEIRRVNVNIAATTVEAYQKLKAVGIGTYQLFQETYHRETYQKLHQGLKADYERQLFAHDRAFAAGIDDIGLGVLFGLYDYRFEVLALISHAQYLDRTYGVGPHTFSVPRWQPADAVAWEEPPAPVSENELLNIIAILRMAVPYTGMIISTRERPEIREKAFEIGISQTSAASRTAPGGYGKSEKLAQFSLADHRTVDDVLKGILKQGLLPSFCTACYRKGRTGATFMDLAKPGNIHNLCRPNALLTFKEYLEDYASPEVKERGLLVIENYLAQIPDAATKRETRARLDRIEQGERDLYF
ncbi:MAG: [FeFe] hydrogenase H-cluster radical SAM maturase HydG [Nanoarchaeota archaeon]|nr:[FeFe] hydrogenase H-cluster radical SAM maturase HydG [Nanoarchaeota archaeon]